MKLEFDAVYATPMPEGGATRAQDKAVRRQLYKMFRDWGIKPLDNRNPDLAWAHQATVDGNEPRLEPRLKALNNGKDASMAWRHLASQMSGYGWSEPPGQAYAYNDYALALYYDTDEAQEGTTAFLEKRRPDFRAKRSR